MNVDDFFNRDIPLVRIPVIRRHTAHRSQIRDGPVKHQGDVSRPRFGNEYAERFVQQDNQEYFEGKPLSLLGHRTVGSSVLDDEVNNPLSEIDELTTIGTAANLEGVNEDLTQVYDNYSFEKKSKSKIDLPVTDYKTEIVSRIAAYPVTIVKGSTGCGKTTQVPQFILDSHAQNRKHCNIVVSQPRRIAAISVAKRVAEERGWQVGTLVGYQVGLEKVANDDTRILYCTTGVLLQKLIAAKCMDNYTHVILDEIHERDEDMDFTMLIVRKFLRTNSPRVKVVLMSATIDTTRFANYFTVKAGVIRAPAVVYDIKGVQNYPVYEYFVDSLEPKCGQLPRESLENPTISDAAYKACVKLVQAFEHIDELENKSHTIPMPKGSVLIFLPGIREIEILFDLLYAANSSKYNFWLCPLHSTITAAEQMKVFTPASHKMRKIILSTNLAESSITVPDVKYVIDFCLTRVLVTDQETNLTSLRLAWASKNSCIQRAGRAGRVADGRVYRMIHGDFYKECLEQEAKPEILRSPLETVVLKSKMLDLGEPKAILALAMDPPDLSSIEKTVLKLKELGALLMSANGIISPHDGDITYMGKIMAALPVDVYVTRLFILGHMFSVFDEAVIIGCCMACKSVFNAPFKEKLESYNAKLTWADSSCSDIIASLNAYQVWRKETTMGKFHHSRGAEKAWADRFYLQLSTLREIARLEDEVRKRLKFYKIEQIVGQNCVKWKETEKALILKIVIAGAFYPNYFSRSGQGGQINEVDAVKMLGGKDPFNTVYLQNLPIHAELYIQTIKKALTPCSDQMTITVNGSKAFVEFHQTSFSSNAINTEHKFSSVIPGKVVMPVYRAVKMRQLQMTIEINTLRQLDAKKLATELGLRDTEVFNKNILKNVQQKTSLLQEMYSDRMDVRISHFENAGHFWVQKSDKVENDRLFTILDTLNKEGSLREVTSEIRIGQMFAVAYTDTERLYYRGRIQVLLPGGKYQVYFVDYGNTSIVTSKDIYELVSDNEQQNLENEYEIAIECVLSEVQPSPIHDTRGRWTEDANRVFHEYIHEADLRVKVYSVRNGVASVELCAYNRAGTLKQRSINQVLVYEGFAQSTEEPYLSRVNHDLRLKLKTDFTVQNVHRMKQEPGRTEFTNFQAPKPSACCYKTKLRGPFSPLEMKVFGMTRSSQGKNIQIEWNSVNSVLLDAEPQDPHERLLVAGAVNQSADSTTFTLRHTTLMPNIHGLASIICILFAPCIELRTDPKCSRLTGVLCGLGVDGFDDPIYAENDMEIPFDTEITLEDIERINRIRFWMSQRISPTWHDVDDMNVADIVTCQKRIQKSLRALLFRRPYKSQEITNNTNRYAWNLLRPEELINPGQFEGSECLQNLVFKLHWGVELNELNGFEDTVNLINNLDQLQLYDSMGTVPKKLSCSVCNVCCDTFPNLKLHLGSSYHKILECNIRERFFKLKKLKQ